MQAKLPIIVLAQFYCTSLWFATNAVIGGLVEDFYLETTDVSYLTSAVQFGFISGTLLFAILNLADRFSPSKLFFWCAVSGSLINLALTVHSNTLVSLLIIRFCVGVLLAGIYPVGMKIAADYYQKGLGTALGYLVGALVLGTALPHLIKFFSGSLDWQVVIYCTSALAFLGGLSILLFVPDGPYRKPGLQVKLSAFFDVFKNKELKSAAFGYFGHMWELYTFWAFVPLMLAAVSEYSNYEVNISGWSFLIIAIGGIGCVIGGYLSVSGGVKQIAFISLSISGMCCLLSPIAFSYLPTELFLTFLLIWGFTVIPDSPLFSTLVATHAEAQTKGTALTIVNCIGFSLTIISIQLTQYLLDIFATPLVFLVLVIGPLFGLMSLKKVRI
ncbi:MFS transporter [Fulvivirga lutea]|uniref:MFS transporter n=1 Tax=Fulvivirga lutea TaxID=2810512 RepID=A0A974WJR1_9BACT|nr:MFS transporter [Fulvivirga lutea]QSE99229.1 MFS transporter [Fulvivirga lutea]